MTFLRHVLFLEEARWAKLCCVDFLQCPEGNSTSEELWGTFRPKKQKHTNVFIQQGCSGVYYLGCDPFFLLLKFLFYESENTTLNGRFLHWGKSFKLEFFFIFWNLLTLKKESLGLFCWWRMCQEEEEKKQHLSTRESGREQFLVVLLGLLLLVVVLRSSGAASPSSFFWVVVRLLPSLFFVVLLGLFLLFVVLASSSSFGRCLLSLTPCGCWVFLRVVLLSPFLWVVVMFSCCQKKKNTKQATWCEVRQGKAKWWFSLSPLGGAAVW